MTAQAERAPPEESKNPAVHPRDGPEQVVELPLAELHPLKDHPFHVVDDVHMQSTAQSIRDNGVLVPFIVRPRAESGWCDRANIPVLMMHTMFIWPRTNRSGEK